MASSQQDERATVGRQNLAGTVCNPFALMPARAQDALVERRKRRATSWGLDRAGPIASPLTGPEVHDELDGRLGIVAGLEQRRAGAVEWLSPLLG